MKQDFNVGIATCYGIHAAIIVEIMADFCKCAKMCYEYIVDGKVYVPKKEIRKTAYYTNDKCFEDALDVLKNNGLISYLLYEDAYSFTDLAKDIFSKKPIRLTITWQ